MSGNSSWSRLQTVPIVRRRRRADEEGASAVDIRGSAVEVGEPVLADLNLVAVTEESRVDALAVDEGAVEAALILEPPAIAVLHEHRVPAGDGDVVEEDPALGRASDHGRALAEGECLARPAPARADDKDAALEPEIVEGVKGLAGVVEREGLGLLALLRHDERRAALRTEARGFRVVVPALGAVDVRHR